MDDLILHCQIRIFHQHRHRHGPDATWNGSHETGGLERIEISIPADLSVYERESYIDDSGTGTNHVFFQKIGTSRCDDDDIGIFGELAQISRIFAANRYSSPGIHQEERKRLPDDIALSNHDDIFPANLYIFRFQKSHNSFWSTGNKIRDSEKKLPDILTRKTIDIFPWVYRLDNSIYINVLRKRKLHDDSMNLGIFVEFVNDMENFSFCCVDRDLAKFKINIGNFRRTFLLFDIGEARRTFSHKYYCKFWLYRKFFYLIMEVGEDGICDGAPVNNH